MALVIGRLIERGASVHWLSLFSARLKSSVARFSSDYLTLLIAGLKGHATTTVIWWSMLINRADAVLPDRSGHTSSTKLSEQRARRDISASPDCPDHNASCRPTLCMAC